MLAKHFYKTTSFYFIQNNPKIDLKHKTESILKSANPNLFTDKNLGPHLADLIINKVKFEIQRYAAIDPLNNSKFGSTLNLSILDDKPISFHKLLFNKACSWLSVEENLYFL